MLIIKPGIPQKVTDRPGTCHKCKCEFRYTKADIIEFKTYCGSLHEIVKCPTLNCHTLLSFLR